MSSDFAVATTKEANAPVMEIAPEGQKLHRKLQARHLEMIAIGGTIGTGLLLRSGGAIARSGPIGALLCFSIVGLQVFGVASSIGEMATLLPVEGAFSHFPARFVTPALGFAGGWNYWLVWALTFPAEMAGIAGLMSFWVPTSTCASWVWSLVYLVPLVGLNLFSVTGFAEAEFFLCIVKIFAIVLFLLIGTFVWFGVGQNTGPLGFRNWSPAIVGDSDKQRFLNIGGSFTTAFFSYGGSELVGLTAGEAANPRKSVPRAINGTFWRILIFYILSIFLVGVLLAPDSPILRAKSISQSPFVYAYSQAGINWGADFMNVVIIVAASSAANSAVYACARTLMRLASEGSAPRFFAKVDKRGVPVNSVLLVAVFGLVAVVAAYASGPDGSAHVFDWLSGVIAYGIMMNWMIMSFTHLRFRAGYLAQGRKIEDLPYVAPFYPYADYASLIIGTWITAFLFVSAFYTNGVDSAVFFDSQWWYDKSWTYFGIPLVFILFVAHGAFKSGFALVKYEDMDFETGKLVETPEQKAENDHLNEKPKNMKEWGQRLWYKLF
ncbi:hypothetical protein HDU79_001782 [Rhizoclosmatium sp. JEL0117]|nr:hypothetical protein HDU79_001782 [Rhizoclosmatium sp. JEL0117]